LKANIERDKIKYFSFLPVLERIQKKIQSTKGVIVTVRWHHQHGRLKESQKRGAKDKPKEL